MHICNLAPNGCIDFVGIPGKLPAATSWCPSLTKIVPNVVVVVIVVVGNDANFGVFDGGHHVVDEEGKELMWPMAFGAVPPLWMRQQRNSVQPK